MKRKPEKLGWSGAREASSCPAGPAERPFYRDVVTMLLTLGLLLLLLGAQAVSGQPGFTSIDCGNTAAGFTDAAGIAWQPETGLVVTGLTAVINAPRPLQTLRYFPDDSTPRKNCYVFPATESSVYIVRVGFLYQNYDGLRSQEIQFQVALDSTPWLNVSIQTDSTQPAYYEAITPKLSGTSLSLCLIRTANSSTPFINSVELRQVGRGGYTNSLETPYYLSLLDRANFGEPNRTYRYPDDHLDRIWPPYTLKHPGLQSSVTEISTTRNISTGDPLVAARDQYPSKVMQTAVTADSSIAFTVPLFPGTKRLYVNLAFAEINGTLQPGDWRILDVFVEGSSQNRAQGWQGANLTDSAPFTTWEIGFDPDTVIFDNRYQTITFIVSKNVSGNLSPILNAAELYLAVAPSSGANSADVSALLSLKNETGFAQWVGDPCFPIPWEELACLATGEVVSLNLTDRNLTGRIPSSISNLRHLTTLDLSKNLFNGSLPSLTPLVNLSFLDISNNNISGTYPSTLLDRLRDNFRYQPGNVGLSCVPVGTAVCPEPDTVPSPSAEPRIETKNSSSSSSSTVIIIGAVAGSLAVVAIVVAVLVWCLCRPKEGAVAHQVKGQAKPYSFATVRKVTDDFAKKIGEGGFGPVYHGVLPEGPEVAVKFLSGASSQGYNEFINEVELLSTVHHRNLVSLLGYCQDKKNLVLMYEFMPGGDLKGQLYGSGAALSPLTWEQRLQIALDSAKGLEYLHAACKPAIIHRDIKSPNILLTANLEAKVADFGLSVLKIEGQDHVSTQVKGTTGYLDPEYHTTGELTTKSDVYSFGVVLLEILTGKPPIIRPEVYSVVTDTRHVMDWVRKEMHTGDLGRVVDEAVGGAYTLQSAWKLAEVAMSCVERRGKRRPDMSTVVSGLMEVMELHWRPVAYSNTTHSNTGRLEFDGSLNLDFARSATSFGSQQSGRSWNSTPPSGAQKGPRNQHSGTDIHSPR